MPKGLIVGCRQARPTASLVANIAGWDYTETYIDSLGDYRAVFRYGNSSELFVRDSGTGLDRAVERKERCFIINTANQISISSNKLVARRHFRSCMVRCPETYSGDAEYLSDNRDRVALFTAFPVIVRPLQHSQGRRFYIVKDLAELRKYLTPEYYISEIIDKKDEYRVLVLNDKVVEVSVKTKTRDDADELIRNHRRGWVFKRIPYSELEDRALTETARRAIGSIGLTFGAVDLCIEKNTGKPYVFEVNSAPGLIERKAEKIATKINEMIA